MAQAKRELDVKALAEKWNTEVYSKGEEIDDNADKGGACYESLCVGWSLAQGLTVDEAYWFYRQLIPLKLF